MKKLLITLLCCGFLTCDDIIEVTDISQETVELLAPTDSAVVTTDAVTFTWEPVGDAETYKLQLATPSFASASQIVLDSTVIKTTFTKTLANGNYEWRLRAENSAYTTQYFSNAFSVDAITTVVDISGETVVLSAPDADAILSIGETINFSWGAIQGANTYTLQIATPNFENPTQNVEDISVKETTFSKSDLEAGDYQWRVKGKNTTYETSYVTRDFKVE
ncbi:hypothetical protein MHTCC0001_14770 [Flavobacteriaceae bacterium MHTCC 0001]